MANKLQLWNHKFTFIETKVKSLCLPNSSCLLSFNVFREKWRFRNKMRAETIKNIISHSIFQDLRHRTDQNKKTMMSENNKAREVRTIWLIFVCKSIIKRGIFHSQPLQRHEGWKKTQTIIFPEHIFKERQLRVASVFFLLVT